MTCVAIRHLRNYFGSTFSRNIKQITLILYSFAICFLVRSAYEAWENVRNHNQLTASVTIYPKQFQVDLESMLIFLLFVDFPIALILFLHHANSSQHERRGNDMD